MANLSGAIDYAVYKNNNKYIVFLFDNHNPESYCSDKNMFSGIENLFEHYINKDSTFVFEELEGIKPTDQYKELFSKTPHLVKYMEFYSKYQNEKNKIKPVDIRILFDNFHKPNGLDLLNQFFSIIDCSLPEVTSLNYNCNIIDQQVQSILSVILNAFKKNEVFSNHYKSLYKRYISIKERLDKSIVCDGYNYVEEISLTYPFELNQDNKDINICRDIEQLLSGLMEIYTIANILVSTSKYVFVYLGAAHCVNICGLFDRYYKIRKVKDLTHLKLDGNRFNLATLDSHTKSCVYFNPGFGEN